MAPIQTVLDVAERGGECLAQAFLVLFILSWPLMLVLALIYS